MDTPEAEPSSYSTFDILCGIVLTLAVLMLVVGGCLLLGAFFNIASAEQTGTSDIAKMESKALTASLVSYGIACFTSGIPLLVFSYGGWIFLDLARNNRLQVQEAGEIARNNRLQIQKTDEILKHLAEMNPKYEERLKREQEAAQHRAEAEAEPARRQAEKERQNQEALAKLRAEREEIYHKRLVEEERQKALAEVAARKKEDERQRLIQQARNDAQSEFDRILGEARKGYPLKHTGGGIVEIAEADQLIEQICGDIDKDFKALSEAMRDQLIEQICGDIDRLFARLADVDQTLKINLTKEIGDQFAQHQSFKNLNINLEPA